MLMTKDPQHGVKVAVGPFHGVGLRVVGRREGETDAKSRIKGLKSLQYLFAGGVAKGYGFKPFAENVLQRKQIPIAFGAGT